MIETILLTTKKPALEHYLEAGEDPTQRFDEDDLAGQWESLDAHYSSLRTAEYLLESHGTEYDLMLADDVTPSDIEQYDLVAAVGGDGTVLDTAKNIRDNTPLLTIRSDPSSGGGLCVYAEDEIEQAFENVLDSEFKLEEWTRAELSYGDITDLALNEIFVGHEHGGGPARYRIRHSDEEDKQMSSGLVVSTGPGSTGWYQNIPGSDGSFDRELEQLKYIAREYDREKDYRLTAGDLEKGDVLEVQSFMNRFGKILLDNDFDNRWYDFPRGETLEIRVGEPLLVVAYSPPGNV